MKLYKVKKSKIDNNGLYANHDIKDRTKIIEYKGKILTKKQVEENSKLLQKLYVFGWPNFGIVLLRTDYHY